MDSTLRLEDVFGDYLSLKQYGRWRGLSERTIRRQLKDGSLYVMPCEEKPHLKWRVSDCRRRRDGANVVRERQQRAQAQMAAGR